MNDIRVQDEQGNVHVFPDGSTPEMIAKAMNVKPPDDPHTAELKLMMGPANVPDAGEDSLKSGEGLEQAGKNIAAIPSGVSDVFHGDIAKGGHKIITGVGTGLIPFMPAFAAASPALTGLGLIGSTVGSSAASGIASAAGATPEQEQFAGDVGGVIGGLAGVKSPTITGAAGAAASALRKPVGSAASLALDLMEPKKFIMGKLRSAVDRLNNPQMDLFKNTPKMGESEPIVSPFESASKPQAQYPLGVNTRFQAKPASGVAPSNVYPIGVSTRFQAKASAFNEQIRPVNKTFDLLDEKLNEVHKLMDEAGIPRMEGEAPSAPTAPRKTSFGATPSRPPIKAAQASANPSPVLSNGKPIEPDADLTDIMMRSIAAAQNKAGSAP